MTRMTTTQARSKFKATIAKASKGQRIVLSNHRKAVAAIVPIEDLELLQAIEDRIDARGARKARAEAKRDGTIPLNQLRTELNI